MHATFFPKPPEISESGSLESKALAALKNESPLLHKIFTRIKLPAELQNREARILLATIDLARAYFPQRHDDTQLCLLSEGDLITEYGFTKEDVIKAYKAAMIFQSDHPYFILMRSRHITPQNLNQIINIFLNNSLLLRQSVPLIQAEFITPFEVAEHTSKIGFVNWQEIIKRKLLKTRKQFLQMSLDERNRLANLVLYGSKFDNPDVPMTAAEYHKERIENELLKEGICVEEDLTLEQLNAINYLKNLIRRGILDIEKAKKYPSSVADSIERVQSFITNEKDGLDIETALAMNPQERLKIGYRTFLVNLGYTYQQAQGLSEVEVDKLRPFLLLIMKEKTTVQQALASSKERFIQNIDELILADKISFQSCVELPKEREITLGMLAQLILVDLVSIDETEGASELEVYILWRLSGKFLDFINQQLKEILPVALPTLPRDIVDIVRGYVM